MDYEIKLLELPALPALTMREVNPVDKLPVFFGKAFGGVMVYLQELNEAPAGMPFGTYYNLDMSALDVEAGFPVSKALPGKGEISTGKIPAGFFISTIHEGAYDSMEPAYDALTQWAQENGYKPSGTAYEFYLNNPSAGEGIIPITEIRFPVSKI